MAEYSLKRLKIQDNKIEQLAAMGINSIQDLILYLPYRYEIIAQTELGDQERVVVEALVLTEAKLFFRGRFSTLSFQVMVKEVEIKVVIFNRHFLKNKLKVGLKITIIGKYQKHNRTIVASEIKLKPIKEVAGIKPVYSLKGDLQTRSFVSYLKKGLAFFKGHIGEGVPVEYKIKHNLINKELALNLVHFPKTEEDIIQALKYLKYEEFLRFQLTMQFLKMQRNEKTGIKKVIDHQEITRFIQSLPFALTKDQEQVVADILRDLADQKMMYRFVQGDVGSGKTIVAAISLYANKLAGFQGALMAPTEILANQHFQVFQRIFAKFEMQIALLTASLKAKEKELIYRQLASGEIDLAIGTHALFQEKVIYHNLGLVVTDEQHRFGVKQRKALKDKGKKVDFLIMSATPIPRTLALSLYGDMDVSTIKVVPKGRKKVTTKVVKGSTMKPILKSLKAYLDKGGQAYVVCPLVNESEGYDGKDAVSIYQGMKAYFAGTYQVGLIHGQLTDEEKEKIMNGFKNNQINILVATTVIEVGVDVSNANMMVIYNADRFGLSQLHQLRGRVGRAQEQGYCYLLTSTTSKEALERLKFLETNNDGFEISKYDLKVRGPGEVLGSRQSGLPAFRIGDIYEDFDILELSRKDARELLLKDSNDPVYLKLKQQISQQLENNNKYVD